MFKNLEHRFWLLQRGGRLPSNRTDRKIWQAQIELKEQQMKAQRQVSEQQIDVLKVKLAAREKQIEQLKQQNAELRAMDTIQQHRTKQLGKRSKPPMT
jgi:YbbR domain-containing protein